MAEVSFKITWKGKEEEITIDDDVSWGVIDMILKHSVDLSDVMKPKVDMKEYRQRIIPAVIIKAPFDHKDHKIMNNIGYKTMKTITQEVMKHYPLVLFLEEWMQSFMGSLELTNLDLDSTATASSDSDGIKKQSTNTDSNSSKDASPSVTNTSKTE